MKNTISERINNRLDDTGEQISTLEHRVLEITQAEQKKEKRIKKKEDSLRELWGNIQCNNIHIIVMGPRRRREKERGRGLIKKK